MKAVRTERGAVFRGVVIGVWTAFIFGLFMQKGVPLLMLCWDYAHEVKR